MQFSEYALQEQQHAAAAERWKDHVRWCDRHAEMQAVSFHDKRIALKLLIGEAHRRHLENCKNAKLNEEELADVKKKWWGIMQCMLEDMAFADNSSIVVKNLSCMSVFQRNVCLEYGENTFDRMQRIERQRDLIRHLEETGEAFI